MTSSFCIQSVDYRVLNMRARMPFRYGIATLTALPHLFVQVEAEVDGRRQVGIASEGLPPKWFTKDPATTFRQELGDMLAVIRHAGELAVSGGAAPSVFDWWWELYTAQSAWGAAQGYPPLLSGLGASALERAAMDAFCRGKGVTFGAAVRENAFGVRLGMLHAELGESQPAEFLPAQPLRTVIARHTVGLADPLTDGDVPADERVDDGLPQSLEACVRTYGLTHFKLKLSGDLARDVARLRQIAVVLRSAGGLEGAAGETGETGETGVAVERYAFTLDGNEQYKSVGDFQEAWRTFAAEPSLRELMGHMLFVEQPLHRDVALSDEAAREIRGWAGGPPMIIDESDGELDSLPRALAAGYVGTSFKNCKGVFRGVANACLVAQRRAQEPAVPGQGAGRQYVISGEDLANVGPVALLQDLAAVATLGITHVERNGHHYFRGLSMLPADVQQAVLATHSDLYRPHPAGYPTLAMERGRLAVGSVVDAPFGTGFLLDTEQLTPLDEWQYETLGVGE